MIVPVSRHICAIYRQLNHYKSCSFSFFVAIPPHWDGKAVENGQLQVPLDPKADKEDCDKVKQLFLRTSSTTAIEFLKV